MKMHGRGVILSCKKHILNCSGRIGSYMMLKNMYGWLVGPPNTRRHNTIKVKKTCVLNGLSYRGVVVSFIRRLLFFLLC